MAGMDALEYLVKSSAARATMSVPQARSGRKSIGVEALLRRSDAGTLQNKDLIHGGRADGVSPGAVDPDALRDGMAVEREHTDTPQVAREIAMDHLVEHPRYYEALRVMERRLAKEASADQTISGPGIGGPESLAPSMFQGQQPVGEGYRLNPNEHPGDSPTVPLQTMATATNAVTRESEAFSGSASKIASYAVNPYLYMRQALAADKPMDVERSEKRMRNLQFSALPDELGRSAAVGAVAAPALKFITDAGEGELAKKWGNGKGLRRGLTAAGVGALAGAAVPAIRNRIERYSEGNRLNKLRELHGLNRPAPAAPVVVPTAPVPEEMP